jgi:Serine carboxypeptidase
LSSKPDLGVNEYAWTKSTTMLYPEQPIGTGFSYGTYPNDEDDVAADLWHFMQNFYDVFDHLKAHKLFIMGESYAGMYLPGIGRYFHLQNEKLRAGTLMPRQTAGNMIQPWTHISIGGVGIGNGWMNGFVQGPAVIDYSWWHGLIDEPTRNALHNVFEACMEQWSGKGPEMPAPFHAFNVQDDCGMMWGVLEAAGNPNAYDITTWDPNVDQVTFTSEAFYNRLDVRKALHAPLNITWHGCADGNGRRRQRRRRRLQGTRTASDAIGDDLFHRKLYLENDRPIDVTPYVGDLLDADIPVLVYNGDRDMTTNVVGSELLLNAMDWKGKDEWLDADRGVWMVEDVKGGEGGWAKEHRALKFVIVYNSGHSECIFDDGLSRY